ncbi:MAG TPA: glycosyltransferase family 39 protein, partial [Anaerolineae bacterium]|nr:glycosyltransferase family 39 protein [Anaerolineae bacterium]
MMKRSDKRTSWGWERWLLLGVIMVGFGLRVYRLEAFSFWIDEGLTPLRAGYDVSTILGNRIFIQEAASVDTHPPFYYLLVHVTRGLWGESVFAYRYFSVLWGILLLPLLWQMGRRLGGREVGLLSVVLATLSPLYVWYSQEARMYTLFVWLGLVMSYCLWRGWEEVWRGERPWRWLIAYSLSGGIALYTHYTALFLIGAQVGVTVLLIGGRRLWGVDF